MTGKELISLSGEKFRLRRKGQMLKSQDKKVQCKVLGRDIAFTDDKLAYKRLMIDNFLDQRAYKVLEEAEDIPKMLDPHDMIFFFKSEYQEKVQDQYHEICE